MKGPNKSIETETENAENDYLDQRLGFAALKRWSEYTTTIEGGQKDISSQ